MKYARVAKVTAASTNPHGRKIGKWTGRTAGHLPALGLLIGSVSPAALAVGAALSVPMLAGTSTSAHACTEIVPGSGDFTCTTSETTTQDLSSAGVVLDVDVDPAITFDTTVGGGNAFTLTSDTAIDFTQAPGGGAITGADNGISAVQSASGPLSIITTGDVAGGTGAGVMAKNFVDGSITISAAGAVSSAGSDGIYAKNNLGTDSITISATDVSGADDGVYARNIGTGAVTITTTGTVVGDTDGDGNGRGISAQNQSFGTDLFVSAQGDVSGGRAGVSATNEGSGMLSVTVTGSATGDVDGDGDGVGIFAANSGTDLFLDAQGDVSGGGNGISASNQQGDGKLSVTASGMVDGDSNRDGRGVGILTRNSGTDLTLEARSDVIGGFHGISSINFGNGTHSVTALTTVTGDIDGNGAGAGVYAASFDGDLVVDTRGDVSGARGISVYNFSGSNDLTVSSAAVSGQGDGIFASNRGVGDLAITTTGAVTGGTGAGIDARNFESGAISITTTGTVMGGTDGIVADNRATDPTVITVSEDVTGGTGAAIRSLTGAGSVSSITLQGEADVGSDSGLAIVNNDGNSDVVSREDSRIVGEVRLNAGDDTLRFDGSDFSKTSILDGGDDASPGDGDIDILTFDQTSGSLTGANLLNWEQVAIIDGRISFDDNQLTAGDTSPDTGLLLAGDGILDAGGAFALTGNLTSVFGGTFDASGGGTGIYTVSGNALNDGAILMSDGSVGDVFTVAQDFAGDGEISTDVDFAAATADRLVVGGSVTGGETSVSVGDASTGSATGAEILLVEVGGVSTGSFVLSDDVIAGPYIYDLALAADQNWYLQSAFLDQIFVYESLPGALQTIGSALTGQLVERVGVRSAVPSTLTGSDGNPVLGGQPVDTALWARAVGVSVNSEGDLDSTSGASFDQTIGFVQAGGEVVVSQGTSGRLLIGALGHWGTSSLDVSGADNAARGSADLDFYGGGLTATWYGTDGLYVDGVVQYTAYDIDISTASRFSRATTDGYGISASGEVGYRIPISATAALVPQAQLVWQTVDFDDFTDSDGVRVSLNDGDSLTGRLGVAFENSAAIGSSLVTGYVEANLLHEFLGDNEVIAAGTGFSQDLGGTSAEVGFGGTIAVNSGVSLYGEVDYTIPFDNGVQGFQALAGVRVNLNPVAPPPPAPTLTPVADTGFIVFFDWDRADLTPEANLVLDDVVVVATETGTASIRLDGYTDLSGSAAYNLGLSERRANSVADGLIARGVAPDEIVIRAFGEENPLVPTPDGVREPQNRRVEIVLS